MAYAIVGNGIVYNKALFAQAGIEELPKPLSELEAVCQKLEAAGIRAFGEVWKNWGFHNPVLY